MASFSKALKAWRKSRRFSQLDLATEAEVSLRHLSFLETGRANPSPEMVSKLGLAMQLPLSALNELLNAAGYVSRYPRRGWDDADMLAISTAVDDMIGRHDPYPAIVIDSLWTLIRMNTAAMRLFGLFGISEGDSMLDLM